MRLISHAFFSFAVAVLLPQAPLARSAETQLSYFRSDAGLQTGTGPLPYRLDDPQTLNWRIALDSGHSTPVIRAGKIFLTTYRPDAKELAVVALEEKSGRQLWRNAIVPERIEQTHQIGNPATATPACDGERLFVFFGSAGLFCYDLEGRKLWQQKMGPFQDEYGAGSSPSLIGDKLILNQDHDTGSFLAAYDRTTRSRRIAADGV
jgi:outer membrane protein assembly factor BamB